MKPTPLRLSGSPDAILHRVTQRCPAANGALKRSAGIPGQLRPYQAAALFMLAGRARGYALDIGTFKGYSASLLAQAGWTVVSLNPAWREAVEAIDYLAPFPRVTVIMAVSWDFLGWYRGPRFGLVFVDGDHKQARRDVVWFDRLPAGGLILFHDAETAGVAAALGELGARLGRGPDVTITDDGGASMAGYYRQKGEAWQG